MLFMDIFVHFLPILVPTEGPCSSLLLVARSFGSRNEHFTLLRDFFHS